MGGAVYVEVCVGEALPRIPPQLLLLHIHPLHAPRAPTQCLLGVSVGVWVRCQVEGGTTLNPPSASPPGAKMAGGAENLLVATHTKALLLYRGSVLTWAAKMDTQPVSQGWQGRMQGGQVRRAGQAEGGRAGQGGAGLGRAGWEGRARWAGRAVGLGKQGCHKMWTYTIGQGRSGQVPFHHPPEADLVAPLTTSTTSPNHLNHLP